MDRTDLYWQRRLGEMERRIERIEAELLANRANPMNTGDYYTVPQLASALNVCELTIRRKIRSGTITAVKVGKTWRIPKTELDEIFRA